MGLSFRATNVSEDISPFWLQGPLELPVSRQRSSNSDFCTVFQKTSIDFCFTPALCIFFQLYTRNKTHQSWKMCQRLLQSQPISPCLYYLKTPRLPNHTRSSPLHHVFTLCTCTRSPSRPLLTGFFSLNIGSWPPPWVHSPLLNSICFEFAHDFSVLCLRPNIRCGLPAALTLRNTSVFSKSRELTLGCYK